MGSKCPHRSIARWFCASASTTGRGHVERGLPCQDASGVSIGGDIAIIVVSDGAGSAGHSDQGAVIAVRAAAQVLRETAPWSDPEDVGGQVLAECQSELTERAERLVCPVTELAATLAFVAINKDVFIAGNLGDGVVAAFNGEKSEVLIGPVRGELANETVFLTSGRAGKHLRTIKKPQIEYDGFAVMSDGAAESLYLRRERSLAPGLIKILSWFDKQASKNVCDAIRESLMPLLTDRTSDDCSLAVLRRVCVNLNAISQKPAAFQKELLGSKNIRGLKNRLAVLQGYRQDLPVHLMSEATGLSERTVRRHRRALRGLFLQT